MLFSSLVFLFMFLPIILFLYYLAKDKYKNYILLISSLIFYAWGEPKYIFLMIFSIIINYLSGFLVCKDIISNNRIRKIYLVLSIVLNIGMLFIFKYYMFVVNNINFIFNIKILTRNIILPLGISFYTFQSLSYVIDVYRNEVKLQRNLFKLALYVSLFPQLVAGPIVRYETVEREINYRVHSLDKFALGIRRFIFGISKKIIISNQLGLVADSLFSNPINQLSFGTTWMAIIAYTLQIYFDFSGYSDMAIGLGKMFGFEFLENFNYPYISKNVTEFWRRWHISLSSWFRDYIYIPLGGNRCSKLRNLINIFIVWMLTGFWHGASWTFIAWGLYYGVMLTLEKECLGKIINNLWSPLKHIYALIIIMIGWVFFRADNFLYSFEFIKNMFAFNNIPLVNNEFWMYLRDYWYIFVFGILLSTPIAPISVNNIKSKYTNLMKNKFIWVLESTVYVCLFSIVIMHLMNSNYNPFIYFRF